MNFLFRFIILIFITIALLCCKKSTNKVETENDQTNEIIKNEEWNITPTFDDNFFDNFSKYLYYGANLDDNFVDHFGIVDYNDSLQNTLNNQTLEADIKSKTLNDPIFFKNLIINYLDVEDNDTPLQVWWAHNTNPTQYLAILYLSKHRRSIDLQTQYNRLRSVFLDNISTERYVEKIRPILSVYLYAFDILNDSPLQLDSLYRYLYQDPLADAGISEYPENLLTFDDVNDEYGYPISERFLDSGDAYSFWIRRINDGNVESVYRTMMSFKRDFDNKMKTQSEEEWEESDEETDDSTPNVIWDEGRDMDIHWDYSDCLLDYKCTHSETYNNDVKKALDFAISKGFFSWFSLSEGYEWPIYYKVIKITNNETGETETRTVDKDLSEREVIRSNESLENVGDYIYSCIVEYISLNRNKINFEQLYLANSDLIREVLTPHIYKEKYQIQVDILISAYKIFDNLTEEQKQLFIATYQLDTDRWADKTASDLFDNFEKQLSTENDISNDTSTTFYVSSFWSRRYSEGTKLYKDTYNTLQRIKENYE